MRRPHEVFGILSEVPGGDVGDMARVLHGAEILDAAFPDGIAGYAEV